MHRIFFLLVLTALFINNSCGQVKNDTYSIDPSIKTKLDKKIKSLNGIKRGSVDFKMFNDDKVVADTKGESLFNASISYLMHDTIFIKGYLGMYGAYGYQILLFEDGTCEIGLFAESETPSFKINKSDPLETDLLIECKNQKLTLVTKPTFKKGEIIDGIVEIISTDFYQVESGKESKIRIEVTGYISTDPLKTFEEVLNEN